MWFTGRLVVCVWLLRLRSHNSRPYSFYLFICLCKPTQMGTSLFFFLIPTIAWHFSMVWYFLPLRYLNQCQAFVQSFAIFSLSHSLCFSPRHNLFLRDASPGVKNKLINKKIEWSCRHLYRCDPKWHQQKTDLEIIFMFPFWKTWISIKSVWWHLGRKDIMFKLF